MESYRSLLDRYVELYNAAISTAYYDNLAVAARLGLLPQDVPTNV